jgi:hypothetical protein
MVTKMFDKTANIFDIRRGSSPKTYFTQVSVGAVGVVYWYFLSLIHFYIAGHKSSWTCEDIFQAHV